MIADTLGRLLFRAEKERDPAADFWYQPATAVSSSGIAISPDTSLQVAAVFACVRVLAETMSSFVLHLYERTETEGGRESHRVASENPLDRLLGTEPNNWQTSVEWHEMMMAHLVLRGNCYNEIISGGDGIEQLIPLNPDRVRPESIAGGKIRYHYNTPEGRRTLTQERVLHIRLFSQDGLLGMNPIEQSRNAIGLSAAAEGHGAAAFKNGMIPPYYIQRPNKWTPEARKNFRESWRGMHGGAENANNPPIMEEGMELKALGVTNEDSQWIESRKFSKQEICGIFRVPPHLVADLERATFSNIEEQARGFLVWGMLPYIRRFEQAFSRDLIDDPSLDAKYNVKSLLRADSQRQGAFYQAMFGIGAFSVNDIRELEDMNPVEDGDQHFVPLNMVTLEQAGKEPPEPEPADEQPTEDAASQPFPPREPQSAGAVALSVLQDAARRIAFREAKELSPRAGYGLQDRPRFVRWVREWIDGKHYAFILRVLNPIMGDGSEWIASALVETLAKAFDCPDPTVVVAGWYDLRTAQITSFLETHAHAIPD